MNKESVYRTRAVFHGEVQGVGFRFTTKRISLNFKVCGFVRNLPDGTVEMVAEGMEREVMRFISAINEEMSGNILKTELLPDPGPPKFIGFDIKR